MQGPQVDASYGLNPTPQSPIGSERVGVKGEISQPTLNIVFEIGCDHQYYIWGVKKHQ